MDQWNPALVGVGLIASWWIMDCGMDALIFDEGSFGEQLFAPTFHELAIRLLASLFISLFIAYSWRIFRRRNLQIQQLNRELEKRAAELSSANEEMRSFGYTLSHDLRSPLNRLSMAAQTLHAGEPLSREDEEYLLDSLVTAAQEANSMVEAILSLTRISLTELRRLPTDLGRLAFDIRNSIEPFPSRRRVELIVHEEMISDVDPGLLRLALLNLMANAWKFTAGTDHPRVELGKTVLGDETVFFIRDNGAGFPAEDAGQLFTPFRRLHSEQEFPGTGIGLATVQRIVHRHGGRIWAQGSIGEGAVFYFTLPSPFPEGEEDFSAPLHRSHSLPPSPFLSASANSPQKKSG